MGAAVRIEQLMINPWTEHPTDFGREKRFIGLRIEVYALADLIIEVRFLIPSHLIRDLPHFVNRIIEAVGLLDSMSSLKCETSSFLDDYTSALICQSRQEWISSLLRVGLPYAREPNRGRDGCSFLLSQTQMTLFPIPSHQDAIGMYSDEGSLQR
jgi:hypothetical protein